MTHILLVIEPKCFATGEYEDPRPPREVVMLVNTGQLKIGGGWLRIDGYEQSACYLPDVELVLVEFYPPDIRLSPRLYEVLFALADGKRAEETAREMGIKPRTVYFHYNELKERLGAANRTEIIVKAIEYGLI